MSAPSGRLVRVLQSSRIPIVITAILVDLMTALAIALVVFTIVGTPDVSMVTTNRGLPTQTTQSKELFLLPVLLIQVLSAAGLTYRAATWRGFLRRSEERIAQAGRHAAYRVLPPALAVGLVLVGAVGFQALLFGITLTQCLAVFGA